MSDGRTALVKSLETRDEHMMNMLLNADLNLNFIHKGDFFHEMAVKYQAPDRSECKVLNIKLRYLDSQIKCVNILYLGFQVYSWSNITVQLDFPR